MSAEVAALAAGIRSRAHLRSWWRALALSEGWHSPDQTEPLTRAAQGAQLTLDQAEMARAVLDDPSSRQDRTEQARRHLAQVESVQDQARAWPASIRRADP